MKIMDEMIIDHTPLADRYLKIYNKKYNNYIKNVKSNTNIYKSALPKVWTLGIKPLFNQIGFGLSKPLPKIFLKKDRFIKYYS